MLHLVRDSRGLALEACAERPLANSELLSAIRTQRLEGEGAHHESLAPVANARLCTHCLTRVALAREHLKMKNLPLPGRIGLLKKQENRFSGPRSPAPSAKLYR